MTILGALYRHDPTRPAFEFPDDIITYGQLCQDIDTLANLYHERGIGPGTRVGIRGKGDQSYWSWVMHLAAIRVGACHATVATTIGTLQTGIGMGLDALVTVVGDEDVPESIQKHFLRPTGLKPLAEQVGIAPRAWGDPTSENHAARLAFTSGTTGAPRGLYWDNALLRGRIEQVRHSSAISESTRLYATLGMTTTGGFRYPMATWQVGGCVIRRGHGDEVARPSKAVALRCSLMIASPINLRNHLNAYKSFWRDRDSRSIFVLGGRLPTELRDAALERVCAHLEVHYGSTETGGVASGDAAVLDRHPGAVGYLRDGAVLEILDDEGRTLPAGRDGIVRIRTEGMCAEYESGGSSETAAGFRDGWFYPGDMGVVFEDGLFAITGRSSETINIGGVKVGTVDVEGELLRHAGVEDICVVPATLSHGDILGVVVRLAKDVDQKALYQDIKAVLPRNCPFRIIAATDIPRNAMGKLQRRQISERVVRTLNMEATRTKGARREGASANRAE